MEEKSNTLVNEDIQLEKGKFNVNKNKQISLKITNERLIINK